MSTALSIFNENHSKVNHGLKAVPKIKVKAKGGAYREEAADSSVIVLMSGQQ